MPLSLPPPRWDVTNIYPGLESAEFHAAMDGFRALIAAVEEHFETAVKPLPADALAGELASAAEGLIERLNKAASRSLTLRSYLYAYVSTDSFNTLAGRLFSQWEQLSVMLQKMQTQVEKWIGAHSGSLEAMIEANPTVRSHRFYLEESARRSRYLMSESEEALAAELLTSGANAWNRLQGKLVSQLSVEFDMDGKTEKLSMPALINMRNNADEAVRRKAYEAEITVWGSAEETLAAAMNGVKGSVNTIDRRRGRPNALHSALETARIDEPTLEAMLSAVRASLPVFQRYFRAKANRFGKERLPWWDLYAPVGKNERMYSFEEAKTFILEHFEGFSPELAEYSGLAFKRRWIDAEQRIGKRAGAFCMGLPEVNESRILANFDGSLDSVFTLAHELGHGFHNHSMYKAGRSALLRTSPMTLNETASILCETIVFTAALNQAGTHQEELSILETGLISDSQVVVDIYSRYLFEKEVFERRSEAELSARELCDLMADAQKQAYGNGLDERYLHPYMWTWKPHYYYPTLSFYNFPYTFGLLFGLGLYAVYQQRGAEFVPEITAMLANTGQNNPDELAVNFDIDIRSQAFWAQSLGIIEQRIERYCSL